MTFDIDANGILNVTASDKATGRSQNITITASSGLTETEIENMRKEAEAHAEEDRKRKELIEVRNHADNTIYTSEKTLQDLGDKVPADLRKQVEEGISSVRAVMSSEDPDTIRKATEELGQALQKVGAAAYQQQPGGPAGTSGGPDAQGGQGGAPGGQQPGGDDVVDGEFKQV